MVDEEFDLEHFEVDDVSSETLERLRQYTPTKEELEAVAKQRESTITTTDVLAGNAADYAVEFTRAQTVHKLHAGRQKENPLEGSEPLYIDNASFIFWVYRENLIYFPKSTLNHNVRTIKGSPNLTTVYNVGAEVNLESLVKGDILFFNKDNHMGIYLEDGKFVSMNGPTSSTSVGGVQINSIKEGYWKTAFNGHVERYTGEPGGREIIWQD